MGSLDLQRKRSAERFPDVGGPAITPPASLAWLLLKRSEKLRTVPKGDDSKMEQPRRGHRSRTYLGGRIVFNGRSSTMDCLIRNLSENGALLEFAEPIVPCHEVDLCILSRALSLKARVVWCDGTRVGVSTKQANSGSVIPLETARLIRKLRADRAALAKRVAELREPF